MVLYNIEEVTRCPIQYFNKFLLYINYMPGIILGFWNISVNKADQKPYFYEDYIALEKQKLNRYKYMAHDILITIMNKNKTGNVRE